MPLANFASNPEMTNLWGQHIRWILHGHCFSIVFPSNHNPIWSFGGVNMSQTENSLVPFAPRDKGNGGDQLDEAGQSILNLLQEAAGVAETNSRHALDMAQKLSHQLRAAEQRIIDLEAEVETYRDRAERAE